MSHFACVAGDTQLITSAGITTIEGAVGSEIEIWNGQQWSKVTPLQTGNSRKLYRVQFNDGSFLDCTENHKFWIKDRFRKDYALVETKDLISWSNYSIHTLPFEIKYEGGNAIDPKLAYTLGVAVGDGTVTGNKLYITLFKEKAHLPVLGTKSEERTKNCEVKGKQYSTKYVFVKDLPDEYRHLVLGLKNNALEFDTLFSWSRLAILSFVAGLADTDGSNASKGIRIYLSQYERAYKVYLLLLKCGIKSSINLAYPQEVSSNFGDRKHDLWYLQITKTNEIPCYRLSCKNSQSPKYKGKHQVIDSVTELPGWHDTFCFEEPLNHTGVFGGSLTAQCNLSEVNLNLINPLDLVEQEKALRSSTLIVASLLHHKFPDPDIQYSREIDPIVAVCLTGITDFFVNALGEEWLLWWKEGRCKNFAHYSKVPIQSLCKVLDLNFKNYLDQEDVVDQAKFFLDVERAYFTKWKNIVKDQLGKYCTKHNLRVPNRYTAVQPSGCLDRTALRIFDQGLFYADEIILPGSGETIELPLSVRNGIATSTGIANQPLQLIKVTLNNNRVLRMTPNHRLSVSGNWVRADQLKLKDKIDFSLGEYAKTGEPFLTSLNSEAYSRESNPIGVLSVPIRCPERMSEDLAYFLGCLFGNGCISDSQYRVRFSHGKIAVLEKLQQIASNLFGLTGSLQSASDRDSFELCFSSKQLYDWLHINQLGKTTKSKNLDRIPKVIRESSKASVLSFITGLIDTDGCIREKGGLSIDMASEDFIRNLQQVGEAVGLCFGVSHNTKGENLQGIKSIWSVSLSRVCSTNEAKQYVNTSSIKCQLRPIPEPQGNGVKYPYAVKAIEWEEIPDYSYDFAVEGIDDNDSWYWQGALKSHNTKSLLVGASPGVHFHKAARYIRRITFRRDDPVALACIDYGYKAIPSTSCKDESGLLLDNYLDPRVTEWLIEIPCEIPYADLCDEYGIDISQFSFRAQFDFYMQVQNYWTTHNTSITLEYRENEIPEVVDTLYNQIYNGSGFVTAAMGARFDDYQAYPRLPFEPISKETFERECQGVLSRRITDDFHAAVLKYSPTYQESYSTACDGQLCELKGI